MSGRLLRSVLVEACAARGGGDGHSVGCTMLAGGNGFVKSSPSNTTIVESSGNTGALLCCSLELSQDKERVRSFSLVQPKLEGAGASLSRVVRSCASQESGAGVTGLFDERSSSCCTSEFEEKRPKKRGHAQLGAEELVLTGAAPMLLQWAREVSEPDESLRIE